MIIKSARECKPFSSAQLDRCEVVTTLSLHLNKNRLSALGQGFFAWGMGHGTWGKDSWQDAIELAAVYV